MAKRSTAHGLGPKRIRRRPRRSSQSPCAGFDIDGTKLWRPRRLDSINPSGYWGEPVNSATGAFWTEQTDARLAGLGIPFRFTRYYSSDDTTEGPLGPGWSDSLDASLSVNGTNVLLHSENGQQPTYTEQTEGNYLGSPGARSVLTKAGEGWLLTRPDQTSLSFNSGGRLTSIKDRNQIGLTLSYNTSGQLSQVTDYAGRVVSFAYNTANRLTSMSFPPARTVHYGYDANNRLISVTDAAGGIAHYTYNENTSLLATSRTLTDTPRSPTPTTRPDELSNRSMLSVTSRPSPGTRKPRLPASQIHAASSGRTSTRGSSCKSRSTRSETRPATSTTTTTI